MPRPYSEDLWWRAIWMKEIPGYQVDEVAAVSRMASPGVRPYCRTRKHQWALFKSCVNWLVNVSSDEGDTNENITWKYKIILFVLLFSITLTRLTSTEMANYTVTKLVGVTLKLRKLPEKFAVMRSCSQQHLKFGHFTLMFCRGWQRNVTKFEIHVQNCCFCSSNLLFRGVFIAVAVVTAQLPNNTDLNGTDTKNRI